MVLVERIFDIEGFVEGANFDWVFHRPFFILPFFQLSDLSRRKVQIEPWRDAGNHEKNFAKDRFGVVVPWMRPIRSVFSQTTSVCPLKAFINPALLNDDTFSVRINDLLSSDGDFGTMNIRFRNPLKVGQIK